MTIKKIASTAIRAALTSSHRQYLVGQLANPQLIENLDDEAVEIGLSSYSDATFEKAHCHSRAREYQLVLKGMTEYIDTINHEVHRFVAGDFYAIYPGTSYAQRIKRDTEILFVKVPAGNDKQEVDVDSDVAIWMKEQLRAIRVDYAPGSNAPQPNSMKPAVAVGMLNGEGKVLLTRRRDSENWTMPGGTMEIDESVEQCAVREVKEETGLIATVKCVIGTYTNPDNIISYSDGEVRREFSILVRAEVAEGELKIDDESTEIGWFSFDQAMELSLASSQKRRLQDFSSFCHSGETFCR